MRNTTREEALQDEPSSIDDDSDGGAGSDKCTSDTGDAEVACES
jgi:hypothetical protein